MKITPLAECVECGKDVPPLNQNVIKSVPTQSGMLIVYRCPQCLAMGRLMLHANEAKRRAHEIKCAERDKTMRERIGREVKGMSVDLEIVTTPADLQLFWNDQERFAPWTVVKEGIK